MAETSTHMQALDRLIEGLEQSLEDQEWDRLTELNSRVRVTVEPVMAQLEAGELEAEPVRERLARLQTFCDAASAGASEARDEARQALKGVNRNRTAARAYQNVSTNRTK
ncbi:SOS cell division inhibitor [Marinobacter goseongensis]|jgi:flagellar protein FliT|uniref:SOS cell division inhibitor n=1 Tax=Marinobacter goseongensis TaxID=453838 RepID=UPI002006AC68|nr:SOS cell division inhibitor [Marinobacter goseongensis]MCK7552139.1 SOS cell division inhibitor [Marinobacter goseongensis]